MIFGSILQFVATSVLGGANQFDFIMGSYGVVATSGGIGYEAFPDITRLNDGRLMTVFYEGYGHISLPNSTYPNGGRIMYVTSSDEGVTWSTSMVVYDGPLDDRDPSVTQLPDGTLLVVFFTYDGEVHGTYIVRSNDAGATWSQAQLLSPPIYGVSSPIRRLSSGRLVAALYYGIDPGYGAVAISEDNGVTWSLPIDIPNYSGLSLDAETDLIELKDGSLWAVERSSNNPLHYATSTDGGWTWSESLPLNFRADAPYLMRTHENVIILGYRGYDSLGQQYTAMRYSFDEAFTWSGPLTIDTVNGAYPSLVDLNDGSILAVFYEEGAGSDILSRVITLVPIIPNTTPLFDSMDSYTTGEPLALGQYDWHKGRNGSSPAQNNNASELNIVAGGLSSGTKCAGGSNIINQWTGSALNFEPVSVGVVDVNVLVYAGTDNRFVIYVQGDGMSGTGDGQIWLQIYPSAYNATYSSITGLGYDKAGEGDDIDGLGWVEININMDFENTTMMTRWRDVSDSTGQTMGNWHIMQSENVLPFHAFDYVELTGLTWEQKQYFDNLTVTRYPHAIPTNCADAISLGYKLKGDFNNDCYINFEDLQELFNSWLYCATPGDDNCDTPWRR